MRETRCRPLQKHPRGNQEQADGVRARRREAYVSAVANRSDVRSRADVQAYLEGFPLRPHAGSGRPSSGR